VTVEILRNDVLLRQQEVPYSPGPLTITARRERGRLQLLVNEREVVVYDPFPFRSSQPGTFGLLWPAQAQLVRLQGVTLGLPPQPSAIERADDLFDRGRYPEALALYQSLIVAGGNRTLLLEARYKAGTCLAQMNRLDDAVEVLGPLVSEAGEQWPLMAAFQLWLIRAQQNRFDEIDALLAGIHSRYGGKQLMLFIPESMQSTMIEALTVIPSDYLTPGVSNIQRAEQQVRLTELFEKPASQLYARHYLIGTYAYAGRDDKALKVARGLLEQLEGSVRAGQFTGGILFLTRRALWAMRRGGEVPAALEQLDRILFEQPGVMRKGEPAHPKLLAPMYLDRARLHVAQGKVAEAEADIDAFFACDPPRHEYPYYANAHLLKGFLLQKKGKEAEAVAIWRAGMYGNYVKRQPAAVRDRMPIVPDKEGFVVLGVLGSLTGELSDEEAYAMRDRILTSFGDNPFLTQLGQMFRFSPTLFREMWRSRHGRLWAEKLAFLDLSIPEFYRLTPQLAGLEKVRQDGAPGPLTAEQEDIAWQAVKFASEGVFTEKISKTQAMQIALTWQSGVMNFLGWGGVQARLDPATRGPMAYTIGLRMLRQKKLDEAGHLFRTAAADAAPGSTLRRLAQAEVDRLKK
jgi:tetratricopeptide (TPR) repeat protein